MKNVCSGGKKSLLQSHVASSNSMLYSVDSNYVGLTNITICVVTLVMSDSFRPCGLWPGSSVHGTSQARILEWVAISPSRGSSLPRNQTCIFCTGRYVLYHLSHLGRSLLTVPGVPNRHPLKACWPEICHIPLSTSTTSKEFGPP